MTSETSQTVNLNRRLRTSYWLMMLSIYAGAFLYGPRFGSMAAGEWLASCLVVGFFVSLPLLAMILFVLRPTPSGVSWMSFLLLGYLIYSIVLMFSPRGLLGGLLLSGTTLTTFINAVAWLRPFKKAAKARAKNSPQR